MIIKSNVSYFCVVVRLCIQATDEINHIFAGQFTHKPQSSLE